ncbi:hypothetical protein BH18THE2_BH18THE2_07390 [soil metagenome]
MSERAVTKSKSEGSEAQKYTVHVKIAVNTILTEIHLFNNVSDPESSRIN